MREVDFCDIDEDFIKSAKMIHIGYINGAIRRAADIMHDSGGKVSVDAAYYESYVYENYDIFDIFIGSEYYFDGICRELGKKTGIYLSMDEKLDVMRYIQSKGPDIVIFTFGAEGAIGVYGDKSFFQPAIEVDVKDSTGAGDVFHGAFDAAYLKGMSVPEAARLAAGVSSIKCTQLGGRAGIPDMETVSKYLDTGKINLDKIKLRTEKYKYGLL